MSVQTLYLLFLEHHSLIDLGLKFLLQYSKLLIEEKVVGLLKLITLLVVVFFSKVLLLLHFIGLNLRIVLRLLREDNG